MDGIIKGYVCKNDIKWMWYLLVRWCLIIIDRVVIIVI